jgi:hypothetical protein
MEMWFSLASVGRGRRRAVYAGYVRERVWVVLLLCRQVVLPDGSLLEGQDCNLPPLLCHVTSGQLVGRKPSGMAGKASFGCGKLLKRGWC